MLKIHKKPKKVKIFFIPFRILVVPLLGAIRFLYFFVGKNKQNLLRYLDILNKICYNIYTEF